MGAFAALAAASLAYASYSADRAVQAHVVSRMIVVLNSSWDADHGDRIRA